MELAGSKAGIALFAHGSRIQEANDSVFAIADRLREAGSYPLVQACFLELGKPDLATAVSLLRDQGAKRVLVIPYFLTLGMHLQRDLPRIVEEIASIHDGIRIDVTEPLEGHPALLDVVLARARSGLRS